MSPSSTGSDRGPTTGGTPARVAFALAVVGSLGVLFAPASGVPSAPPGVDTVVHLLVFGALALSGRWTGIGRTALAVGLLVYAGASEVVQALPALGRSASAADVVADAAGALVGLLAWERIARRPR